MKYQTVIDCVQKLGFQESSDPRIFTVPPDHWEKRSEKERKIAQLKEKRNSKREKNVARVYSSEGPENENVDELCAALASIGESKDWAKSKDEMQKKKNVTKVNTKINLHSQESDISTQDMEKVNQNSLKNDDKLTKKLEDIKKGSKGKTVTRKNKKHGTTTHVGGKMEENTEEEKEPVEQALQKSMIKCLNEQLNKLKLEKDKLEYENCRIKEESVEMKSKLNKLAKENKKLRSVEKLKCYSASCIARAKHRCSGCTYVMYCSEACSVQNWPNHMKHCGSFKTRVEETEEMQEEEKIK